MFSESMDFLRWEYNIITCWCIIVDMQCMADLGEGLLIRTVEKTSFTRVSWYIHFQQAREISQVLHLDRVIWNKKVKNEYVVCWYITKIILISFAFSKKYMICYIVLVGVSCRSRIRKNLCGFWRWLLVGHSVYNTILSFFFFLQWNIITKNTT